MRVIYKQEDNSPLFEKLGINNCYFKQLYSGHDMLSTNKRMHHHTVFEIHFVRIGTQLYQSADKIYSASSENMLIIPPGVKHNLVKKDAGDSKFSLTFSVSDESCFSPAVSLMKEPLTVSLMPIFESNFDCIIEETRKRRALSGVIVENRVLELIIEIMRICGFKKSSPSGEVEKEDARLAMAKQYIKDNIEINLKLPEVAAYCYIGTKQLTRLFKQYENITPAMYIQKERVNRIVELMGTSLSLGQISEKMNFSSEYHFNSFFKKMEGQPPGEYRRMLK